MVVIVASLVDPVGDDGRLLVMHLSLEYMSVIVPLLFVHLRKL